MDIKRRVIQSDNAFQASLIGASTPNGEFSTTITCEVDRFILFKAIKKGAGFGFPFSISSPVIMKSKYLVPIFLSKIASTSSLAAPLTTALIQDFPQFDVRSQAVASLHLSL